MKRPRTRRAVLGLTTALALATFPLLAQQGPAQAAGSLAVAVQQGPADNDQQTGFSFTVRNTGSAARSGISVRIYFTADDANPASSYTLEKYYDQSGAATVSGPADGPDGTSYFTVDFGGASLAPGASWKFETNLHLSGWGSTYSSSNDWFHTGYATGELPASGADDEYLPAYVGGTLEWGKAPGTPATPPAPTGTDLARGKPATASSTESDALTPDLAVDDDPASRWSSTFSDPQWLQVDLQQRYDLSRVVLRWEAAYASAYRIELSDDGTTWSPAYSTTTGDGGDDDLSVTGSGRYVRMQGTTRATEYGYSVFGLEAYGTPSDSTPPNPPSTPSAPPSVPAGGFADPLDGFDSGRWAKSDWVVGDPFDNDWKPDNVSFSGGAMTLTMNADGCPSACRGKPYAAGEYRTNVKFGYGRYEASFKPAKYKGMMSGSLFTYTGPSEGGDPWDEIDIEFLGDRSTQIQTNYYTDGVGGHEHIVDLGFDASQGFHTYAFTWTPSSITWFVDGRQVWTEDGSRGPLPTHPGKVMLNAWPGAPSQAGWLGPFTYTGPAQTQYDWVAFTPQ